MLRTILVACLLCATAFGDEPSPKLKKVIEAGESHRKAMIESLERSIDRDRANIVLMKKGTLAPGPGTMLSKDAAGRTVYKFPSKRDKDRAIAVKQEKLAGHESELKAIRAAKHVAPRVTLDKMNVGDIGIVTDNGRRELLVKIQQVVDADNVIVSYGQEWLWLKIPTAGFVDGRTLTLDKTMEVTGTRRYSTVVGGSKTVFVLVPFEFPSE